MCNAQFICNTFWRLKPDSESGHNSAVWTWVRPSTRQTHVYASLFWNRVLPYKMTFQSVFLLCRVKKFWVHDASWVSHLVLFRIPMRQCVGRVSPQFVHAWLHTDLVSLFVPTIEIPSFHSLHFLHPVVQDFHPVPRRHVPWILREVLISPEQV